MSRAAFRTRDRSSRAQEFRSRGRQTRQVARCGPIRALHVFESWRPVASGNTARSWGVISGQETSRGIQPSVVVSSRQHVHAGASLAGAALGDRTAVLQLDTSPLERAIRPVRRWFIDGRSLEHAVGEICDRLAPDLVHVHYSSTLGAAVGRATRRRALPLVAEIRFDLSSVVMSERIRFSLPGLPWLPRHWFERHRHDARLVVAASFSLGELLQSSFPDLAGRLRVVPNGVDLRRFSPGSADPELARELGIEGRTVIGFASTMYRWEGFELFLDALRRVRETRADVVGLLVGAGPMFEHTRARALSMGVPVAMTGRVPPADMPRYYRLFDVFVVPRIDRPITRFASPIKAVEAMATGLPIVATKVGDLGRLLAAGRGRLTRPAAADIAHSVLGLVGSLQLRRELGERARAWARAHASWDVATARYEELYREALDLAPGAAGA